MTECYINAFHHKSRHAGEFSFNGRWSHDSRATADEAAEGEMKIEPETRRVGVWRVTLKEGVRD